MLSHLIIFVFYLSYSDTFFFFLPSVSNQKNALCLFRLYKYSMNNNGKSGSKKYRATQWDIYVYNGNKLIAHGRPH